MALAARKPGRWRAYLFVAPALLIIGAFFVLPLVMSAVLAFRGKDGGLTLEHFAKAWDFYSTDLIFTVGITLLSTVLIGLVAIAIAGYLTLGENPRTVAILRWLYRWPLFIPFIVTGQVMRTFLAKNGMLNHVLIGSGIIDPLAAQSLLDWRGIVIAFVWKQAPFVTLLLAGAMASIESQPSRQRAISARGACACCTTSSCLRSAAHCWSDSSSRSSRCSRCYRYR